MRLFLSILLCFTSVAIAAADTPVAEIVHRFGPGPLHPTVPLTPDPDGSLYGVTEGDSTEPAARVFRFTPAGRIEALGIVKDSFRGGTGVGPLSRDSFGNFWGVAANGGTYQLGVIFHLTPRGTVRSYALESTVGKIAGRVLSAGNGDVYCFAQHQQTFAWSVFRTNATSVMSVNKFSKLADLSYAEPALLLTTRANEMIGSARAADGGVDFFRVATSGAATTFAHAVAGQGTPVCLVEGTDGTLYGVSTDGGANGHGGFFRLVSGSDAAMLFDFPAKPAGTLSLGEDGKFYGVLAGDAQTPASSFRLGSDGTYEPLGTLPGTGATGLLARGGKFYGTIAQAEDAPLGEIVGFDANGSVSTKVSFQPYGIWPRGMLTADASGNVYGVTYTSGPGSTNGMVYKISADGVFTTVAFLPSSVGSGPDRGVTLAPDGTIYGVTSSGGDHGYGGVFRLDPLGQFTLLGSFGLSTGRSSNALCLASDGMLYGTCSIGGAHGLGTIYRVGVSGGIEKLWDLSNAFGYGINSQLVEAPDGGLYGVMRQGGPSGRGIIARIATTYGWVNIGCEFPIEFRYLSLSGLALGPDGAFYGLASGTFFRWKVGETPTRLYSGGFLVSGVGLVLGTDGRMYGASRADGRLEVRGTSFTSGKTALAAVVQDSDYGQAGGLVSGSDGRLVGTQTDGDGFIYQFTPQNRAPQPANDRFSVRPGTQMLDVLANDADDDRDDLSITSVTAGMYGNVVLNPDGTVGYTPRAGFPGTDVFTYEIADGYGGKATGTVEMFNTPPVAQNIDTFARVYVGSTHLDVSQAVSDPDEGQTLKVVAVGVPAYGAAAIEKGQVVYRPRKTPTGEDTFTYTVSDGFGGSATAEIHVTDVPFLAAGRYGGTAYSVFEFEPTDYLVGPIQIVVSKAGTFTAVLAPWLRVAGTFSRDGHFSRVVKSLGFTYTVELHLDPATHTISGRSTDEFGLVDEYVGTREVYSAKNPSPQAGRYTFLVSSDQVLSYRDQDNYQFGTSYGTMNVSPAGQVRLAGRLGDGSAWTSGARIYGANLCSFRAAPPYPGYSPGLLKAAISFADLAASDAAGECDWSRLIMRPLGPISLNQPGYRVEGTFAASRFTPAAPLLILSGETSNTRIAYVGDEGGPFVQPWEETLSWSANNVVTRADPASAGFKMQPNGKTGLFTGSFRAAGKLYPFAGAVLQKSNVAGGYFRRGRNSGSILLTPTP